MPFLLETKFPVAKLVTISRFRSGHTQGPSPPWGVWVGTKIRPGYEVGVVLL